MLTAKPYRFCCWAAAICLLLIAGCLPGCSSGQMAQPKKPPRTATAAERGRIEHHFLRGSTFQMQGEFHRAIGEFQRVLRVDAAYGPALAAIARCWQRLGHPDSALQYAAAAAQANPEYLPSRQHYAELLATNGEFDSAAAQCQFILARQPYNTNAHYMIAVIMQGRDPAQAISHYEFLRRTTEDDYDLLLNLAELYLNTSQFANAASTLGDAVELAPGDPDVYVMLIDAYRRDSDWSGMMDVVELATNRIGDSASVEEFFLDRLSDFTDNRDAGLSIGAAQREYGLRLATAAASRSASWRVKLHAGIVLHAADSSLLRADTLARQGLSSKECTPLEWEAVADEWIARGGAVRALRVLLPAGWRLPKNSTIPLTLGQLYSEADRPDSAEWYTRLATTLFPGDADGWSQLGELLEQQGRLNETYQAWDRVIEYESDDLPTLCRYAVSLADHSIRLDDALRMAQLALRLNDSLAICHDAVGWVLFKMDQPQQALPHLERAAEMGPALPIIFQHLAEAYQSLGYPEKARVAWEKAER